MPRIHVGSNVAAEYASFLGRVLGGASGDVRVVSALTDTQYRTAARGGTAARLLLRLRMYAEYPVRLVWHLLVAPSRSVFVVTSNTFFMPWVAAVLGRLRGHRVVHLLYDLFPEAMVVGAGQPLPPAGAPLPLSALQRAVAALMRSTFRTCRETVFIGHRLQTYAEARYGRAPRSAVIAVGSDGALFSPEPPARMPEGDWTILYSGQLGRMHDYETMLSAWRADPLSGYRFAIRGGGRGMQALETELRTPVLAQVQVGGSQGTGSWVQSLEAAPIGLITLRPGAEAVVFPSKTFSAMQAGQAILAVAPETSDLADLVRRCSGPTSSVAPDLRCVRPATTASSSPGGGRSPCSG
jgi:hypothetical protein